MLNAERAFRYFEEIAKIPRQSGDEGAIADYIERFAADRGLDCYRDGYNNVLVRKPASAADCECPPVIVQGHTDMVYVRDTDCAREYSEGLELYREDGFIRARGTTLGADDGVAVAYMLALLESDSLIHPEIEALFTAAEEIGLIGAANFDCSRLRGRYLINLDMESEGHIYSSCAGGCRHDLIVPMERESVGALRQFTVSISGLLGGHSGAEIHKGRANAIVLMGRLLTALGDGARLLSVSARGKDNAICNNARAVVLAPESEAERIIETAERCRRIFSDEYGDVDNIEISVTAGETRGADCYTAESVRRLCAVIALMPCGVLDYSRKIPGLVETSSNIGVLAECAQGVELHVQSRSMVGSRLAELKERFAALAQLKGCRDVVGSEYPQWEYRETSHLRQVALETYEKLFGVPAVTDAIHAGLECGFFSQRLHDCDIIAFGPDTPDVHTTSERVSIASFEREFAHLALILETLAGEKS